MSADADVNVVGVWVTADGHIRQKLLSDGRYDEAHGSRSSACTGRYTVTGHHLDYVAIGPDLDVSPAPVLPRKRSTPVRPRPREAAVRQGLHQSAGSQPCAVRSSAGD